MKHLLGTLVICVLFCGSLARAGEAFDRYFADQTLRIDYHHAGDAEKETVSLDRLYAYGTWAGSLVNLIDKLDYGAYRHALTDAESGAPIYARGFDSYFKEYQSTATAKEGTWKTFHETAIVPLPKAKAVFSLEKRAPEGHMVEVFRVTIDPADVAIIRNEGADPTVRVVKSLDNGDPHTHADIAVVGEGYTVAEEAKFRRDLERFTKVFFASEPCKSHKARFNVYGILKPSAQSGIDEPRHGSFRATAVGATFNSMGSERYILTEENQALRDIARHVPYDALYIMVNHHRYGGGGIYNFYCTFTADNQWSEYLMVHEFGHSFFGLADEYYTSAVAYEDYYATGYEPAEPNITAESDRAKLKWKHLVAPETEIPTPWEKSDYDAMDMAWQETRRALNDRVAGLRRSGAPEAEVKAAEAEYDRRDREHAEKMYAYLSASERAGEVGAFEGAGYASTGLYRPMVDCIMFTKAQRAFCKVCAEAMTRVIEWYAQ
ncbi:MAG: IgA Peptidase M64 [Candidatus Krumholzibacteria bacterium]|nr:IgA Peptidase M64 [Candidatus Krumholzibacteria bacterium]